MVVHDLSAPDMVVRRGWQPMETFPTDGTVVQIIDATGFICKAQWNSGHVLPSSLRVNHPTAWRELE